MRLGSREADDAYDRWHDRLADAYFHEEESCDICGSDRDAVNELQADAGRYRWLRDNPEWLGKDDNFNLDNAVDAAMKSNRSNIGTLKGEANVETEGSSGNPAECTR